MLEISKSQHILTIHLTYIILISEKSLFMKKMTDFWREVTYPMLTLWGIVTERLNPSVGGGQSFWRRFYGFKPLYFLVVSTTWSTVSLHSFLEIETITFVVTVYWKLPGNNISLWCNGRSIRRLASTPPPPPAGNMGATPSFVGGGGENYLCIMSWLKNCPWGQSWHQVQVLPGKEKVGTEKVWWWEAPV